MFEASDLRQRATRLLGAILSARGAERAAHLAALRPAPDDFALVFEDEVAAHVRASYERLWARAPAWQLRPEQTELAVAVASVDELRTGEGASSAFPGGYRRAARAMRAGRLLVAWEVRGPGASAVMSYDGLVPMDPGAHVDDLGRWAWFPKPWRALPSEPRTLSHWSD
jgi:hypothetical protein